MNYYVRAKGKGKGFRGPGVCSVIVTDGQRQMSIVTENTKVLTDVTTKRNYVQFRAHEG